MSFFAGAIIAKAILDTAGWTAGSKTMNTTMGKMGKGFVNIGKLAVGMGVAIGAALVKSIGKANEWQKEFSNVTTLLDETQVNTQGMAKELLMLDARLGDSTDLTKGLYQALSASVEPTKAVQFVGDAAKFAKAALIDTNTAVDVITTGLNAYGFEADKATTISDQLFSVIKLGKTTGQELSAVIGQSIPLAANMGIGFDQLGASIAIMTRQGINASQATTQFNGVINAFLKPSSEMEKTLKQLGYESGSAAIESLGFKGALDAVVKSTGGSKEELAELFRNTRALRGVMALTGEGAKDFDEVLAEIQNSAGATNTAFEKQEITFDTLTNTLGKGQIIIGNIGKVFADQLAVGATQAAQGMIDFLVSSQGAELVSEIIGRLAAGFEALKIILMPLIDTVLTELQSIWETLTEALDTAFGVTEEGTGAFNAFAVAGQILNGVIRLISTLLKAAITNIGNLIAAIRESGGVIGSFFDFLAGKKTWEEVEGQATKAGDAFKKLGKGIVNSYVETFGVIFDEVSNFEKRVNKTTSNIEVKYKTTFTKVKNNTRDSYDEMITGQENLAGRFGQTSQDIIDAFNRARNASNTATNQINDNLDSVSENQKELAEGIKESWDELGNSMVDVTAESFGAIGEWLVLGTEATQSFGEVMKEALTNAIGDFVEALGRQFLIQAAAALIPGPSFNPVAAAGYAGVAAAAFVAAGVIRALQFGGNVGANEPVLVGEAGPELFVPAISGRVFSNEDTRNMNRNITINNYNTIGNSSDAELVSRKIALRLKADKRAV